MRLLLLFAVILVAFATPAMAVVVEFTAALDGSQIVPPVDTPATGSGSLYFDTETKLLTLDIAFEGLVSQATKAHIHGPAPPGMDAATLFLLTLPGPLTDVVGPLSAEQEASLFADLYYVVVHTQVQIRGEIRGQIIQAAVPIAQSTWGHIKQLYE